MLHINTFLNKMAIVDSKNSKDIVLTINDARGLRDEITSLLADLHQLSMKKINDSTPISIEIKGGSFK